MSATVLRLHNARSIAAVIRVGHRDHRWLEDRLLSGRLPYRRYVFEAAHIDEQMQLVEALKKAGHEIILDTNFAELGSIGKFNGAASKLPWARKDRPWRAEDLGGNRSAFLASQMAEFAISRKVNVILSPSHLCEEEQNWLPRDAQLSNALRVALDRLGGSNIAVDFQLILTAALLKQEVFREETKAVLADVDAENVWLRTSGFDAHSTGTGTRRFIEAVRDLHSCGKPLVGDMVGGMPALAAAAAGAIGGISHGVGQKESFRASEYRRVPVSGGGGGARRVYVADLGRWISEDQFRQIVQTKGAKSKLFCRDSECCPQGKDDMIDNPKAHFLHQRAAQIRDLSRVPEMRREEHFLVHHIGPALSTSRALARLKFEDSKTLDLIQSEKKRLGLMNDVLRDLLVDSAEASRSEAPLFRGGNGNLAVLGGRG